MYLYSIEIQTKTNTMETFKNTYTLTQELIEAGNKKVIFDKIYLATESEITGTIAMFIKDCSSSFCADIANRINDSLLSGKTVNISEKQAWCLTFEVIKIKHQMSAWIEKEIELSK